MKTPLSFSLLVVGATRELSLYKTIYNTKLFGFGGHILELLISDGIFLIHDFSTGGNIVLALCFISLELLLGQYCPKGLDQW